MNDQNDNPYEVAIEIRDEARERKQARPWVLIVVVGMFGIGGAVSSVVCLTAGEIALSLGQLPATFGYFYAAAMFASGQQKRGDWFFCGSFVLTILGVVPYFLLR